MRDYTWEDAAEVLAAVLAFAAIMAFAVVMFWAMERSNAETSCQIHNWQGWELPAECERFITHSTNEGIK